MQCPVCRAQNDQGPTCRRCKADLTLLFDLEEQRSRALAVALDCVRRGRLREAKLVVMGVEALQAGDDCRRMRAVVHLLEGKFARAWEDYCTMTGQADAEA